MDQSTLLRSFQTRPITTHSHIKLCSESSKVWIRITLILSSPASRKAQLLESVERSWLAASDLANKAVTVTPKSAIKLLASLTAAGDVEAKIEEWTDHKYRKRKRLLFRLHNNDLSHIDILNKVFGITPHITGIEYQIKG